MRHGKGLNQYQANDYHNRIELCLAHVNSGVLTKMRLENAGIAIPTTLISVRKLCIEAIGIYMADFDNVDHQVVEVAYYRRINGKTRDKKTRVHKYGQIDIFNEQENDNKLSKY